MYTALIAMVLAQPGFSQAPALRNTPPIPELKEPAKAEPPYRKALRNAGNSPVLVFVKVPLRQVAGFVAVRDDDYPSRPGIVQLTPRTSDNWWGAWYYPETATNDQLRQHAGLGEPAQRPFSSLRPGELPYPVDDDLIAAGRWPERLLHWKTNATQYLPAQLTQRTFNKGIIEPVSRKAIEEKYQVPGHMVGVTGWRSELYAHIPGGHTEFVGPLQVLNGFTPTSSQEEYSLQRRFPDGTYFLDALYGKGNALTELRLRTLTDGLWESDVIYRNKAAWPTGYKGTPTTAECAACHSEAGSGKYGVGLVPGGHNVLSLPLKGLEETKFLR